MKRCASSLAVLIVLSLTLSSSITMASERVYKWVDESGTVHFGQKPPTSQDAEALDVKSGYTEEAKKTDAEVSEEMAARMKYCDLAKTNLEALSSDGEVQRKDEYGNVTTMTPEEIAIEKVKAEDAVKEYCGTANP